LIGIEEPIKHSEAGIELSVLPYSVPLALVIPKPRRRITLINSSALGFAGRRKKEGSFHYPRVNNLASGHSAVITEVIYGPQSAADE
jgi:hypothetical protein